LAPFSQVGKWCVHSASNMHIAGYVTDAQSIASQAFPKNLNKDCSRNTPQYHENVFDFNFLTVIFIFSGYF